MKAKYLTNVELNPSIKAHLETVNAAAKKAEDAIAELNVQGDKIKDDYEVTRNEHWEQIKTELNSKGLITAEEKQFGIFQINNHHQIFLMGIDQKAKEQFLDEQEEKELAEAGPAPTPLKAVEATESATVQ